MPLSATRRAEVKIIQKPVIKVKVDFRNTSIANRPSAHGKASNSH